MRPGSHHEGKSPDNNAACMSTNPEECIKQFLQEQKPTRSCSLLRKESGMARRIPLEPRSHQALRPKLGGDWEQSSEAPSSWAQHQASVLPAGAGLGVPLGLVPEHGFHLLCGRRTEAMSDANSTGSRQYLSARTPTIPKAPVPFPGVTTAQNMASLHCCPHTRPTPRSAVRYVQSKTPFRKGSFCYKWCLSSRRKNDEVTP